MNSAALCALLVLGLLASAHAKPNKDDALRSRVAQFQHVLQPLEPSAEIVTTSTPAPAPLPGVPPAPPVVEIIETLGWQYTNAAYIYSLLAVAVVAGLLYFYFTVRCIQHVILHVVSANFIICRSSSAMLSR